MSQLPTSKSEQEPVSPAAASKPWETPTLDVLPIEETRANGGVGADSNASSS